jgi:hypothetical protein
MGHAVIMLRLTISSLFAASHTASFDLQGPRPPSRGWAHIAAILGQEPEIRLPKMAPKRKSYTTTSLETGHA